MSDPVWWLLRSGRVRRWHTMADIAEQSVAEHAWGVAVLVLWFGRDLPAQVLSATVVAALVHDAAELEVGDAPHQVKRDSAALADAMRDLEAAVEDRRLKPVIGLARDFADHRLLKTCDLLEMMRWCSLPRHRHTGEARLAMQRLTLGLSMIGESGGTEESWWPDARRFAVECRAAVDGALEGQRERVSLSSPVQSVRHTPGVG